MKRKHVIGVFGLIGALFFAHAPTHAATITYNFTPLTNSDIGASANYTVSGVTITAAGFTDSTFSTTADLFSKNGSGDENGLGLVNDPTGDNEISGTNLIRISLPSSLSNFSFKMGSSTNGEGWLVYGSNSATTGYALVASGSDENDHVLTGCTAGLNDGCYQYYYFMFNSADLSTGNTNVLLGEVDVSTVPLPAALPLFASGLVGLTLLSRRKRRKIVSSTAT